MRLLIALVAGSTLLCGCAASQPTVQIDWVDFVQLDGITYVASWTSPSRPLLQSDVGSLFGKVKVMLDGTSNPNHKSQDGDAAFLTPGTGVYRINGYRASFRLAATNHGRLTLYEADTNPKAVVGADLVDLKDKVLYIGVNSEADGRTELAAIKDSTTVRTLVDAVEMGSVDQTVQSGDGPRYFIDFHMADRTEVVRAYWPQSGELARGIRVSAAFRAAITAAVP